MQKKITLWSLASVLVLLLGLCTALFPSSGSVAQAASVRIDDDAVPTDVQSENYPDFGGFASDGADFGADFGGDSW